MKLRVLCDENLPHKLRHALAEFNPITVQYLGWSGLRNGDLLNAAEASGFDVLVTGDKTIEYEQTLKGRTIAVVSLSAPHWPLIKDHVGQIGTAIAGAKPGSFSRVECGSFTRRRPSQKGPALG